MCATDANARNAPQLSVSMIVRNESQRLPAFLDWIQALPCEVCLVDTGSTDDTVAIARAGGCRVSSFSWCDDFAAARNAALSACRGDWILSLDADERIAREDLDGLLALLNGPRTCCYRFVTRNYTDNTSVSGFVGVPQGARYSEGFAGWFPSTKVRLFPRIPHIAFEGAVHELIGPSLERQGVQTVTADIPIHHHPLLHRTADEFREKQRFYLELGKRKVAANPADPKAHNELGDQYVDLGELAAALQAYKQAVRLDPGNPHWLKGLGSTLLLAGQIPQAIQALRLSLQRDPSQDEGWRNLGVAHVHHGDWVSARTAFESAVQAAPEHPENARYLAIARHSCGDTAGAIAVLEPLLRAHPWHAEAVDLYLGLMASLDRQTDAEAFLAHARA